MRGLVLSFNSNPRVGTKSIPKLQSHSVLLLLDLWLIWHQFSLVFFNHHLSPKCSSSLFIQAVTFQVISTLCFVLCVENQTGPDQTQLVFIQISTRPVRNERFCKQKTYFACSAYRLPQPAISAWSAKDFVDKRCSGGNDRYYELFSISTLRFFSLLKFIIGPKITNNCFVKSMEIYFN